MIKRKQLLQRVLLGMGIVSFAWSSPIFAASTGNTAKPDKPAKRNNTMEEVVVTAQRVSQNIQNVPIAVTALTSKSLRDKQIINPSDLQMNAPNVSFSATNFGGSNMSIRGIGRLVVSANAQSGVSNNINQIPINSNQNAIEFYDVKRVEILRGPQGTLFGRNATGGAVNIVTNMPDFNGFSGHINTEIGNYRALRVKGAVNIPITNSFAIRLAGLKLHRDGEINNTAYGQKSITDGKTLPNIGPNMDGRALWAFRASAKWDINDNASGWVIFSRFYENDDKTRITNQVCVTNPIPTTGCLPNAFGFQQPNLGTTTDGIFGGLGGALPLGAKGDGSTPIPAGFPALQFDYPQPANVGFRVQHTDFQPLFQDAENLFMTGWNYDFSNYTASFLGAYQQNRYLAQQDYKMDVGATLQPTAQNPAGYWPTSAPAGGAGAGWSGPCNVLTGNAGVEGGCIYPADTSRIFAYDQSDLKSKYWTMEAKIQSHYSGPFNFVFGVNSYHYRSRGDYYVLANSLDLVTTYGVAKLGFPPLYPGFYDSTGDPNGSTLLHGYAAYGETYFDLTPSLKLTVGARWDSDSDEVRDTGLLYNAVNINALLGGTLGSNPVWTRLTNYLFGDTVSTAGQEQLALANYYAPNLVQAAATTAPLSPERFAVNAAVPIVPGFNETRNLYGNPYKTTWRKMTGRIGLNWQVNDNSMAYIFLSRGYKPGGFNPPINPAFKGIAATFKPEGVNSLEIGSKNMLADDTLMLNGDVFYYNYQALQVSQIQDNNSINVNVNAHIYGVELESAWHPDFMPNLALDATYSYLHTALQNVYAMDPANRTAGNPDWVTLENIDPGSLTGTNYIASTAQITQTVVNNGLFPTSGAPGMLSDANGQTTTGTTYPVNQYGVAIPAYTSQNYLISQGVQVSPGLKQDLTGNRLPNSPMNTVHLGVAYTWDAPSFGGNITARWDSYWQGHSYARIFNTQGDYIHSWVQNNVSLTYVSRDGNLSIKGWVTNLNNHNNVTGKYLTSDTSGFYRNYFLTNPRLYGATVTYNFGGS